MRRTARRVVWTLVVLATLAVSAATAPFAFRRIDTFRVHRVEVAGARFLSPAELVTTTGITDSSNVFDDAAAWSAPLERHALVDGVRVERRPPHTLRFHIIEAEPVALVALPELRPVDAGGRVLPIETAGHDLDLPVLTRRAKLGEDSVVDETSRRLIDALVTIRALDAVMAARISEIAPAGGGGIRILLDRGAGAELLLPDVPGARALLEVRLALDHLQSAEGANAPAAGKSIRIDARYDDELFVTLPPRGAS